MNIGSNKITTLQTIAILGSTLVAVVSFTFPRSLAHSVGTPDMWITVILGGGITLISGFFIVKLTLLFPEQTFYQFNQMIVGKMLGSFLSIVFAIYAIFLASFELRSMGEVTKFYLLENTPVSVIIIAMLWTGIYLLTGGINAIARLFELIYPITIVVFLLVILLGLKVFDINNLRPVLGLGILPVLKGIPSTLLINGGMEFLLIWVAYMQKPKEASKVVRWGVLLTIFLYLVTIVVVAGALTVERLKVETWPTLTLIQSYEYAGILFERFESMFLVVWLMQIFATYIVGHYVASIGLSQISKIKYKRIVFLLIPIIYLLALIPSDINTMTTIGKYIGYMSLFFSVLMPACLLVLANIKGAKGK